MIDTNEQREDIERAAAEWLVRLGGKPLNSVERAAFDDWLTASPGHLAAFEQVQKAWSDLDVLKGNPGRLRSVIAPAARPSHVRLKRSAVIGGLALLIVGLGAFYRVGNPWIALTADYRTGPGEVRTVRLIDGTMVDLGSSSALVIDFNNNVRRVRLLSGEATLRLPRNRGRSSGRSRPWPKVERSRHWAPSLLSRTPVRPPSWSRQSSTPSRWCLRRPRKMPTVWCYRRGIRSNSTAALALAPFSRPM